MEYTLQILSSDNAQLLPLGVLAGGNGEFVSAANASDSRRYCDWAAASRDISSLMQSVAVQHFNISTALHFHAG